MAAILFRPQYVPPPPPSPTSHPTPYSIFLPGVGHHWLGNGLAPDRCKTITWTNADLSSIRILRTNFSKIPMKIQIFSFKKKCFKFCLQNGEASVLKTLQLPRLNTTPTPTGPHTNPSPPPSLTSPSPQPPPRPAPCSICSCFGLVTIIPGPMGAGVLDAYMFASSCPLPRFFLKRIRLLPNQLEIWTPEQSSFTTRVSFLC